MDDFDRAQENEERDRKIAIQSHARRTSREPRSECEDCDEPLPDHRQQYGTCVYCQTARESRARHYRQE